MQTIIRLLISISLLLLIVACSDVVNDVSKTNNSPVTKNDIIYTLEDRPVTRHASFFLDNDNDPDANDLISIESYKQPKNGRFEDNGNNTYTYTPNQDYVGTDSVEYTITDEHSNTAVGQIQITIESLNDAPRISIPDIDSFVRGDIFMNFQLSISDPDTDSASISYSISGLPEGLTIDTNTVEIVGKIAVTARIGLYYIVISADDGQNTTQETFVWTVMDSGNTSPVAVDDKFTTLEDTSKTIPTSDILGNDSDIDPNTTLSIIDTAQSNNGRLGFDSSKDEYTYTPEINFSGEDRIRYIIHDGQGGIANADIIINVTKVNDHPQIVNPQYLNNKQGDVVSVKIDATDIESINLSFSATGLPTGLTMDDIGNVTGIASASGEYQTNITVVDEDNGTTSIMLTWYISPTGNSHPQAQRDTLNTNENILLEINVGDLLVNDTDIDNDTITFVGFGETSNGIINKVDATTYTYEPDEGFYGAEKVIYAITDGNYGAAIGELIINVQGVNDAPTFSVNPGDQISIESDRVSLLIEATDPDLDTLTYIAVGLPTGLSISTLGNIQGQVDLGTVGTHNVTITVKDGETEDKIDFAWTITPKPPEQFYFVDQDNIALSTEVTSEAITVLGFSGDASVSIVGGEYSIGSGEFTSAVGTISNGQSIVVRQTSSAIISTTTDAVLTVGGVSDTFSVRTSSIATYAISTETDSGLSFTPANITVNNGETASFTITIDAGHSINNVGGCNGTLSGNIYTTGSISASCTIVAAVVTPATFHTCNQNDNYQPDSSQTYWIYNTYNYLVPEDNATFQCSNFPSFARDSKNLYIGTEKYPVSDFSDLKFINGQYAINGSTVISAPSVHGPTFKIIDPSKSQIHYQDRSNIFLSRYPLDNVDYDSFQLLGEGMARDNSGFIISSNQRYLYTHGIFDGLDIKNFQGIGGNYFRSPSNEIYYFVTNGGVSMKLMSNVDVNSFRHISGNYAKDDNTYYLFSTPFSQGSRSLTLLGRYFSTDGQDYYRGWQRITDADSSTFQVNQKYGFAYDNGAIYRNINGFSGSFSIAGNTNNLRVNEGGYIYTDGIVTTINLRMKEDPSQVQYLGGGYLIGQNSVYYLGIGLTASDPLTFSFLGLYRMYQNSFYPIGKDANTVYSGSSAQSKFTDASNFELLSFDYARDATQIFHGQNTIGNVDLNTFTILGRNYSKDVNNAYYRQYTITNAVAGNFSVIDDNYAHDSNTYFYQRGNFGSYSPTALSILEAGYATVADSIYFQGRLLSQTGASSFNVIVPNAVVNGVPALAQDATNLYAGNNVIPGFSLDLTTFQTWNNQLFGDAVNVFSYTTRIASAVDFELKNQYHYRDGSQINFLHPNGVPEAMPTADIASFQIMSPFAALDNDEVFFAGTSLPGLDPATSIHPSHTNQIITDTDTMYYDGILIQNINVSQLVYMQYQNSSITSTTYYKDTNVVYYRSTEIVGADAASFVVLNSSAASDVNTTYINGVAQ